MHTLALYSLLLAAVPGQAQVSQDIQIPTSDVTQAKIKPLDKSLKNIQELVKKLKYLETPMKRPSEVKNVRERWAINEILLKGRAHLLIQLRHELEEALKSRYELEAHLAIYMRWLEITHERNTIQMKQYADRINRLKDEHDMLADQCSVVSFLLTEELSKELGQGDVTTAAREKLRSEIKLLSPIAEGYSTVINRDEVAAAYQKLTAAKLRIELQELLVKKFDTRQEIDFLETGDVLGKFPKTSEMLEPEQVDTLKNAKELLLKSQVLEDHAAKVAMMSRHLREWLHHVRSASDVVTKARNLEEKMGSEPVIVDALKYLTGDAKIATQEGDFLSRWREWNYRFEQGMDRFRDQEEAKKSAKTSVKSK